MGDYASEKYLEAKKWVSKKITDGYSWDDVKTLCVSIDEAKNEFIQLRDDELILPEDMEFREWPEFIDEMKKGYSAISDPYGLSNGSAGTTLPIPTDPGSPWTQYKKYLLGQKDGKRRISDNAVTQIEKNSHWILNHILRDTRVTGPKKGLVMGSVQSGKTANMIGLATMAAHYDWNYIIILSGTIDNLRKQTRDRFMHDLLASGGVAWHILDKTGNPNYMVDVQNGKKYMSDNLELNLFQNGKTAGQWMHRYVTVCLKNSTRLRNLITWLHANPAKAARLRILVIDDEADQASVNTRKIDINETEEELIERTAVNQLIIDLVNGKNTDGTIAAAPFQAMNYISFTATPYANVLNEAYESSLYPKDLFLRILKNRRKPKREPMVDGYGGFLFLDKNGRPMVALHWEKYMQHAREKYNRENLLQLPPVTPHICRHTYCTNMANSGMNPKTLQYLMGHSDVSVTLNIYTHTGYDDAKKELARLKEARDELEKKKFITQKHAQTTHVSLIS